MFELSILIIHLIKLPALGKKKNRIYGKETICKAVILAYKYIDSVSKPTKMRTKLYNCLSPKMNTDSRINSYTTQLQISLTLLLEYFILALFHKKMAIVSLIA